MPAEGFEIGDIHFLDIGEMRNVAFRLAHPLGNEPAQPDDFNFLGRWPLLHHRWPRPQRNRLVSTLGVMARALVLFEIGIEVTPDNTPVRTATRNIAQVNTRFMRTTANGRRGRNPTAMGNNPC